MKLEVLVAAMHQTDLSLASRMNIRTDALIINQCNSNAQAEMTEQGRTVRMLSLTDRGVGKSRNSALMQATGDICLMADDDEIFVDDYEILVLAAFQKNPAADLIFFNVESHGGRRPVPMIKSSQRIRKHNCLRYGTFNMAFRRSRILKRNVFFSLLFGGGAPYGHGEDSLFIWECLSKGLVAYARPDKIADMNQVESTWFTGFNEKYFFDQGVFFGALSKAGAVPLILQYAVRHHALYKNDISLVSACRHMLRGLKHFQAL